MRIVTILSLLLWASTAFGELTKEDLRTIIREEIAASEKRMKEYIDLKIETVNAKIDATNARIDSVEKSVNARIDNVEKRIDDLKENINRIWLAILALIAAAVALPQLIIVYTERKRGEGDPTPNPTTARTGRDNEEHLIITPRPPRLSVPALNNPPVSRYKHVAPLGL